MHLKSTAEKLINLPAIKITSGSIEAVKWLALLSMTIDHVNRVFFNTAIYPAYCIGRLAMPLFAFILAYNLAQPGTLNRGVYSRVLIRLIIFGILAIPGYMAMRHLQTLYPLNIMFSLAASTAVLYFYEEGGGANKTISLFIILLGGLFVEYDWIGIIFCITAWCYCRKPSILSLFACIVAFIFLDLQNRNSWALLSIAVIFLATKVDLKIPRIPYLFYVYYPLHLTVLYLLKKFMV